MLYTINYSSYLSAVTLLYIDKIHKMYCIMILRTDRITERSNYIRIELQNDRITERIELQLQLEVYYQELEVY